MKLAYMYATPDVGHSKVTAIRGPIEETLLAIRDHGYTGVEFLVRDASQLDAGRLEAAVAAADLDMPAVCTGEVYGEDGLSFADPVPHRRREAIERMKSAMELGERFAAPVNVGRLRGRLRDDVPGEQTIAWIAEALAECAGAYPDGRILIEPVNHEYANCLLTTRETLEFIAKMNLPNVGIMLDVAHMLEEGEDPTQSLHAARDVLWHFHVTDSDRLPVGVGTYDIAAVMRALTGSSYDGYVTVETFQVPDGPASLKTSAAALSSWFPGTGPELIAR